MVDGGIQIIDDLNCQNQVQIFRRPIGFLRFFGVRKYAAGEVASSDFYSSSGKLAAHPRQKIIGDRFMHQQRFHGIAHTRTLDLGIEANFLCHFRISLIIDINMADPLIVF